MKVSTMHRLTSFVILSFFTLNLCFCAKLPPNFKKCDIKQPDFKTCEAEAVHQAMRQLTKPYKELGIPSLDPLEVPSLTIEAGTSAVGLQQKYTNIKIYGINNVTCSKMEVDLENHKIQNLCDYPEIRMEMEYEIDGKVLLLEVHGSGPGLIRLEKVQIPVNYDIEEYVKNGKKHIKITEIDLKLLPGKVEFKFDNLFNGDKLLSDNVHKVINENWRPVFEDVSASYDDAFGQICKSIFNQVLSRVPLADIFGEK